MDGFGTLKLFAAVSLLGGVCHCWNANVQERVTAIRGSCVLVACRTVPYSKVIWYKYKGMGYPVVYSEDSSAVMDEFRGRTSVLGSAENGNCSLKIDNVQEKDSQVDLYVWIWKYGGDDKGFYDRTTKITVRNPVTPEISVASKQTEGKEFSATCKCLHSCPSSQPRIDWLGLNIISNVLTSTEDSEGLWVTKATAKFRVTHRDQNAKLSCRCINSRESLSSNSVSLDVLYAPSDVKIDYIGNRSAVEGGKISLTCNSKSKPEPSDYEWRVTQTNPPVRSKGKTIVLDNVQRHTSVSCIAINDVGRGESDQLSLHVHYAPTDVKVEYTGRNAVVEGNKFTLRCSANGSPAPTQYDWSVTRNGTTSRGNGQTFVLKDVMRNTFVSCTAANSVGRGESKQLLLDVQYPPSILSDSFCSTQNGTLHCACHAEANPNPVISWTVDGSGALFPLYNTTSQQSGRVRVSGLKGPPAQNVTCTATNNAGTNFIQISVLSEGNILAVSGIAAGIGGCIMLGLAVIAFVIWKKRRHAEPHEGLCTDQQVKPDRINHEYYMESDNEVYANTAYNQQARKDEDAEACIYENYDKAF